MADSINLIQLGIENKDKILSVKNQFELTKRSSELKQERKNNRKNQIILLAIYSILLLGALFFMQKNKIKNLLFLLPIA